MSSESAESLDSPNTSGPLSRASQFFYTKSNLVAGLLMTSVFVGYLGLFLTAKGTAFEVANSNVRSLGTSLGFGQAEILAFFAERSDQMIDAYIGFNQIWDTLFGLIYGLMYVVWVSVLLKSYSQRAGVLNLLPFGQVVFDWIENFALVALSNQFLADGVISPSTAVLASTASVVKWVFSLLIYVLILVGIVMRLARAVKRRRRR
jgi:hypothetical protein